MPDRMWSRLEEGRVVLAVAEPGARRHGSVSLNIDPWYVFRIYVDRLASREARREARRELQTPQPRGGNQVGLTMEMEQGEAWSTTAPYEDAYFMISLWAQAFLAHSAALERQRDELILEMRNRVWFGEALQREGHRVDQLFPIAGPTSTVAPEDAMSSSALTREELERAWGQLDRRQEECERGGQEREVARHEPPQPADRAGRAFRDLQWSQPATPSTNTGNLGHMFGGVATVSDEGLVSRLEIHIDEAQAARDESVVQVVSVAKRTRLDRRDTVAAWEQEGQEVTRRTRRAS